jgi:hypothetical protein
MMQKKQAVHDVAFFSGTLYVSVKGNGSWWFVAEDEGEAKERWQGSG